MGTKRPNVTRNDLAEDISRMEISLRERERRFWNDLRVEPSQWKHSQYPGTPPFWVIAILGARCLYLNEVEGGWGWGCYTEWGTITEFQFQQDEIQHVVYQTLFAIDHSAGPAYRAPDSSPSLGGEETTPAQLGFTVADGESVDVSFIDGDLILRFKDWHEQIVEHRFIEALAFRWSARSTVSTPRNDESYQVSDSTWLRDECQLEGYSADRFAHHVLCFNAEKVLEVISRRANP